MYIFVLTIEVLEESAIDLEESEERRIFPTNLKELKRLLDSH